MVSREERMKGFVAIVCCAVLWSTGGLLIKMIPWSALSINAARCIVALVVKTGVRCSVKVKLNRTVLLASLCFAGTTTLFVLSNKLTTAANAIVLQYTSPLFIILGSWFVFKKKPTASDVFSSFAIIAGVVLCCIDSMNTGGALGNFLAVCSGFTFGMMFFMNSFKDSSPDDANYLGFIIGALIGLPFLLQETDFSWGVLVWVLILGAVQLGLGYIIFEYGIRRIGPLTANLITGFEPFLSPVWVAVFYGEMIGPFAIVGGVIIVFAITYRALCDMRRGTT